jgi:hypothetical protein
VESSLGEQTLSLLAKQERGNPLGLGFAVPWPWRGSIVLVLAAWRTAIQRNFPAAPTPVGIDTSGIGKRLVSA